MRVGFTGTSHRDLSVKQVRALREFFTRYRDSITEFHHGDCIKADEQAHGIAAEILGVDRIWIHPPLNPSKRAFCESPHILPPKDYLPRDHDIVDATSLLLVCPKSLKEELRSGTWATKRYAVKRQRIVVILEP